MSQAKESIHGNKADNCMFGILSLEDDVLRLVSQHLSKTSRAIFAAAMTASSPRWAKNGYSLELLEKSKIILAASSNAPKGIGRGARLELKKYYEQPGWSILDGRDWHYTGESIIVEKLEDCDFAAVLYCIGARVNLKHLRLGFNVQGMPDFSPRAFLPLKCSSVLEELSVCWGKLSPAEIIPIICSTHNNLEGPGASTFVRKLELPHDWTKVGHAFFSPPVRKLLLLRQNALTRGFEQKHLKGVQLKCDDCNSVGEVMRSCYLCNKWTCLTPPGCGLTQVLRQCHGCNIWLHQNCMGSPDGICGTREDDEGRRFCCDVCLTFYCPGCIDRLGPTSKKVAKPCISLHYDKRNSDAMTRCVLCGDCRDRLSWDKNVQAAACKMCCDKVQSRTETM